jgi:membrane protein
MRTNTKASANDGVIRRSLVTAAAAIVGAVAMRLARAIQSGRAASEPPTGETDRGRAAEQPLELSRAGWKDVLWRTYAEFSNDRILLVAAGITFYALLALFPALTALVSIAGFMVDPTRVVDQLQSFSRFLPAGALDIIGGQMQRIASQSINHLSFAFATGLGIALWSANNGIKAMFDGLNVVYDETEERSFLRLTFVSLLFTLGAIFTVIIALGAIVVVPAILALVGLGGMSATLISLARWPILFALIVIGIGLLYRFGPSRSPARWRWISLGSLLAACLWVAASALFSWYVSNFSSYNEMYGSLGAVIAFMVWMWISTTIVLLGAELNAELEHQTARDTTTAPKKPMGSRGAEMADSVGQATGE